MPDGQNISKEDWYALNELALLIYDTPLNQIYSLIFGKLKNLIPFSHSLHYLIRYEDGLPKSFQYESADLPQSHLRLYLEKFIVIDFINWYARSSDRAVFRESDVVPDSVRLNSSFMSKWMMPMGLYHGLGVIITRNGIKYADIFLYRGKDEEDFSDRDVEILSVLQEHLSRKFAGVFPNGIDGDIRQSGNILNFDSSLTEREREIVAYIDSGVLRANLCSKLHITENTLNKHLANIYRKLNITTFEELMQMLKAK